MDLLSLACSGTHALSLSHMAEVWTIYGMILLELVGQCRQLLFCQFQQRRAFQLAVVILIEAKPKK
ncbi:hypothetical protein KFU94_16325 [Chloroflexi bacterium TSY]|nr:hypothetical protein [Chloroflexi bacterium TSY]